MTPEKVIEAIMKQIDAASPILQHLTYTKALPGGIKAGGAQALAEVCYDSAAISEFEEMISRWQYATKAILSSCFGADSEHTRAFENSIVGDHVIYKDAKEELAREVKAGRNALSAIIDAESLKTGLKQQNIGTATQNEQPKRPPKVFISHKKEDKDYADALVNLINFIIGSDGDKIFCSSVQGYGIKQSRDIMDELKAQFENHDIFMVIIHSPRYYQSAVCLNEMGAAWVMGTHFSSFLTKDCKPDQMRGVINKEKIFIDPNDDSDQLNAHLNDFKNDLVAFFGIQQVEENKWENARNRFVKEVSSLTYEPVKGNDADLFEQLYLPTFDHIFEMLDVNHFQEWTYSCGIGGSTILSASIYERLDQISNYIKSRPKHSQYSSWDALMHNLGLLVSDFQMVFSQHEERLDEKRYWVERFYKRNPNNPHYERDLEAYNQYVYLVSDLLFELARLCNLILGRIRQLYPVYKQELGLLHIDNNYSSPDLIYSEEEISDAPYPGLDEFIRVRLSRETHYGTNPNINASGYEEKRK